jgi:hypothetical protein
MVAVKPESEKDKKDVEKELCNFLASTPINKHMNAYEVKTFNSIEEMIGFYFPMSTCKGELVARVREQVSIRDV